MNIDQRHYDVKPASRAEKITLIVFSAAFVFMMLMEMISSYEPRKLALLLFILWWIPLVLLHELGHALVAKWLGWKVTRTVIGFGKVMITRKLFGAPLEFRLFPIEGFVQMASLDREPSRFKQALIALAGPGIEFLLVGVILIFLGWDGLFLMVDNYWLISIQSLAFAALVGGVLNLIPMGVITKEGHSPNDGMIILMCLFKKNNT